MNTFETAIPLVAVLFLGAFPAFSFIFSIVSMPAFQAHSNNKKGYRLNPG